MKRLKWTALTTAAVLATTLSYADLLDREPMAEDTPMAESELKTVSGSITDIDMDTKTIVVKGAVLSKTFRLGGDTAIHIGDDHDAKLDGLEVGDEVTVTYREQGDLLWATQITQTKEHDHPAE